MKSKNYKEMLRASCHRKALKGISKPFSKGTSAVELSRNRLDKGDAKVPSGARIKLRGFHRRKFLTIEQLIRKSRSSICEFVFEAFTPIGKR